MRRKIIGVLAVALIGAPLTSAPNAAVAATGITFVEGPDRLVIDVSSNGRFVLTRGLASAWPRVIDRQTGISTSLAVSPSNSKMRISGDGTRVVFLSDAKVLPVDSDAMSDAYSVAVDSGALTLLTPGQTGWEFDDIGDTNAVGSAVLVRGTNGGLGRTAPFVGDGASTRELASWYPNATNANVYGMTATGNMVFYSTNGGCTPSPCPFQNLYVEEIDDPLDVRIRQVGQTWSGASFNISEAAMSADGYFLIARESGTGVVYTGVTTYPNSMMPTTLADSFVPNIMPTVAIASGGSYAYLQTIDDGVAARTQAVLHAVPSSIVASSPLGGTANGDATSVVLSDDATTILFSSRSTNLVPAPSVTGLNVYVRGTSPPSNVFDTSFFTPRTPTRILDTRNAVGYAGARPAPSTSIVVPVRGLHGVPADASAVAVQMTAAEGDGIGYLSAFPTSTSPPTTSNLNLDTPGETIANMAIVPIGPDGSITVYTSTSTHVILDLMGWWSVTQTPVSSGRYSASGPNRILDTRPESPINWDRPKPGAGSTTLLHVAGQGGVPSTGASAVVINVTLVDPSAPGFVQAAPASQLVVGSSSTLNVSTAGQVIASTTIVPLDSDGNIAIYAQPSTHLVVDLSGWFTDTTAPASSSGLFVPVAVNHRDADTRVGLGFQGPTANGTRFDIGGSGGALVGNVTITNNIGPGYVQLGPTATMVNGSTSSINVTRANETIANSFIVPINNGVGVFTSNATHVIIDSSGYMTP